MTPRALQWLLAMMMVLAVPAVVPRWAPAFAADPPQSRITGTVTYRERVALTRDAVLEVTLEEASRADYPAAVIAETRMENPGRVPIAFTLRYDPRRIVSRGSYVVRASIYQDGRLRFSSDQAYPVLTQGHDNKVSILMRRASEEDWEHDEDWDEDWDWRGRIARLGALPATFSGLLPCADCVGTRYQINLLPDGSYMQSTTYLRDGHDDSYYELGLWSLSSDGRTLSLDGGREGYAYWFAMDSSTLRKLGAEGDPFEQSPSYQLTRRARVEPMEPRVPLVGMFRYVAGAARFRDCFTGIEWPVALSGDYRELERAYSGGRGARGSELLVSLDGRIEDRRAMEGSGTEPMLVVERFRRAMPRETCEGRAPRAGLTNTRWRPILIGDWGVTISAQEREPWILLDPRTKRVTGFGGCNRISGNYEVGKSALRFGPLISTKMACRSMEIETAFVRGLEVTRRYRVRGRTLDLLDDRGRLLVRLEERNLR